MGPTQYRGEWEVHGPGSPGSPVSLTAASSRQTYKRRLGPTEVSYYLGSRGEGVESGVNDMYLHVGFDAPSAMVSPERVLDVWTEIVDRHALLACEVEYDGASEIYFSYEMPKNDRARRMKAKALLELRASTDPKEFLDTYLNGPRTLSDQQLSSLVLTTPSPSFSTSPSSTLQSYDLFLLSTHFLGDGMALHTTMNEFLLLLAADGDANLDRAMESQLITPEGWGRMAWAGARVEFQRNQAKLVGGQAFPRASLGPRRTLVPTISYDSATTKRILGTCKTHGATVAHTVFALCNLAFIRCTPDANKRLPCMLYSALNLRPFLATGGDAYKIAIGYYNIILPTFLPSTRTPSETFWSRALSTRKQTSAIIKSPFLASRSKLMALERERRSIGFEKEDERRRIERKADEMGLAGALKGLGLGFGELKGIPDEKRKVEKKEEVEVVRQKKKEGVVAPSVALMGVSMLGNLDGMYAHASYPSLKLHTLTTGSRQRPGALLLFAYTFAGKLWFSLGYDVNGFERGVIEEFWTKLQDGVDEFLLA
ncbi:hypothetical protein RQP46_008211 [Phenoliferia psychrophenolica]